ncbi:MAG: hypothetical protein WAR78_01005 [Ferruginibacter sp.]
MKKLFTLSASVILAIILLSSCRKSDVVAANNENYWLSKEEGEVVYSDPNCSYIVVETYNGYNIVRTSASVKPYEGELVYGNFSSQGTRDMYNYSANFVFTGTVTDYWLTYNEALDALDFYCPFYGKGDEKRVFQEAVKIRKK